MENQTHFAMENQNGAEVVKTGEWVWTLFLTFIPLVNIIMFFVWAFGSGTNPNKANWAKASLIWIAIVICIYILIFLIFGAAILAAFQQ
jgi:hypothetical protein